MACSVRKFHWPITLHLLYFIDPAIKLIPDPTFPTEAKIRVCLDQDFLLLFGSGLCRGPWVLDRAGWLPFRFSAPPTPLGLLNSFLTEFRLQNRQEGQCPYVSFFSHSEITPMACTRTRRMERSDTLSQTPGHVLQAQPSSQCRSQTSPGGIAVVALCTL